MLSTPKELKGEIQAYLNWAQPQLDAGKDVIIVGHGAMDSSIVCQVQNIPLEKFWDAFRQKWSETRWISEW